MRTPEPDNTDDTDATDVVVAVSVVRSGGIAGISRRWGVHATGPDSARWIALVDDCPWDARDATTGTGTTTATGTGSPTPAPAGADRFTWSVHARLPGTGVESPRESERHADLSAQLSETQASGPWRTLIDAVREASDADRR